MAGLARVLGVYRLLERVREAEAMLAGAGVTEAEQEVARVKDSIDVARESMRAGVIDPVLRAQGQAVLDSGSILQSRLDGLLRQRVKERQRVLLLLAESRLQVKQVEQIVEETKQTADAEEEKRVQSEADERFLQTRFTSSARAAGSHGTGTT